MLSPGNHCASCSSPGIEIEPDRLTCFLSGLWQYTWSVLAADAAEPPGTPGYGVGGGAPRYGSNHLDGRSQAFAARGLLDVAADPADRRARLLTLTPKGRRLLARAVPIWKSAHLAVEHLLPDRDTDRFRRNLRALS
jgi:hypothetical protein